MIYKKITKKSKKIKNKLIGKKTDNLKKKEGFSLIEVVIAITLMAILSGIAMASYTKVQNDAKKNMDYTTAANIATAAQLANLDGESVEISNLVNKKYLQSTPQSQQKDGGNFEVTITDDGKVSVTLNGEIYYPKGETSTTN